MKVPAIARQMVIIESENDVEELWKNHRQLLRNAMILSGGSNVVFTRNVDTCIILNRITGIRVMETEDDVWLETGAGEDWQDFIDFCLKNNYGGVENLSLIPGRVGACPIQNIGAYGVEVKDVIEEVKAFDLEVGMWATLSNRACAFGYRSSIFKTTAKGRYLITKVKFKMSLHNHVLHLEYGDIRKQLAHIPEEALTIQYVSEAVTAIRRSKLPDPAELPNCGSFFKNPIIPVSILRTLQKPYPTIPYYEININEVKVPAAWLIEQAGWKGKRVGKIGIHHGQALVIVNYDGGTGEEIRTLAYDIARSVEQQFGIVLECEVNVL